MITKSLAILFSSSILLSYLGYRRFILINGV